MLPLLILVFLGGYFLLAGVFFVTALALREFSSAFGEKRPAAWVFWSSLGLLYGAFLWLSIKYSCLDSTKAIIGLTRQNFFQLLPFWVFVSVALCLLSMFAMEKRDLLQGMASIASIFYIIFFAFHLVLVDNYYAMPLNAGPLQFSGFHTYVWIVMLSAFGTDVFAYFTGMAFGKHKLCPSISPKKTVEGAIGGVCGSILLCGLFSWLFMPTEFWVCIVLGVAGGIFSQFGDLTASVMKRKIGIKDWGTLLPGHGGMLDRVDSMLFVAPLFYYMLSFKDCFNL